MTGRIAGIIKNDFSAAPGVCLTVFVQGCDVLCPHCHNQEQQDFEGGKKYTFDIQKDIIEGLVANGVERKFCIMGGEPCCSQNAEFTFYLIQMVRTNYPGIPVYVWTGYTYEQLLDTQDKNIENILSTADFLIDGPYIHEQRDITLAMKGSRNQRVINLLTKEVIA